MKKLLIIALAGTIALTSCRKSPEDVFELLEIQFAGQVLQTSTPSSILTTGITQSLDVFLADDRIGIFMIKADPGTLAEENILVKNRELVATGGATTSFVAVEGAPIFFPNDPNESVRFVAYHPFSEDITTDFRLPIDLSDQSDLSKHKILYVPVTVSFNRTRAEVIPLEFRHQLTRLVFNITNGAGASIPVENGLAVRISGQHTQGELYLTNGEIFTSGELSEIVVQSSGEGTTVTAEAMVFPGSTAGVQLFITNEAGQEFVVTLPGQTWAGSTLYTYSIELTTASSSAPIVATLVGERVDLVGILR